MMPFNNGPAPSKLGFTAKAELPAYINILFRARPPLDYVESEDKEHRAKYDLVHDGNTDLEQVFEHGPPPERICHETPAERKERLWKEKIIENYLKIREERKNYDPKKYDNATGDPYKTLFVSKLNYKTDEDTLRKEFERFGPVANLRLVRDKKTGKSRGYCFVEFKHMRHAERLYDANGMKIDGKRIFVDFEQSRVDKDWLPKRLGGGKGHSRRDRENERKIRQVIKEWKRAQRSNSRAKDESKASSSLRKRDSSKLEKSEGKRQKVSETKEVVEKDTGKQEKKEETKEEVPLPKEEKKEEVDKVEQKVESVSKVSEKNGETKIGEGQVPPPPPVNIQNSTEQASKPAEPSEPTKKRDLKADSKIDDPVPVPEEPPKKTLEEPKAEPKLDSKPESGKEMSKPERKESRHSDRRSSHRDSSHKRRHKDSSRHRESSRKRGSSRHRSKDRSRDRKDKKDRRDKKDKRDRKDKKDRREKKDKRDKKDRKKDKKKHDRRSSRDKSMEKEDGEF